MRYRAALCLLALAATSGCDTRGGGGFVGLSSSTSISLAGLVVSAGTLTPAFSAATTSYSVTVPNTTSQLTVRPTASTASASITVNGQDVTNGAQSSPVTLTVGANNIPVVVSASSGASRSYVLTVNRAAAQVP